MQINKTSMSAPQSERRLTIPDDVFAALVEYSNAERKRMASNGTNPLVIEMITPLSLAQHILKNDVQKRGYWSPPPYHYNERERGHNDN